MKLVGVPHSPSPGAVLKTQARYPRFEKCLHERNVGEAVTLGSHFRTVALNLQADQLIALLPAYQPGH